MFPATKPHRSQYSNSPDSKSTSLYPPSRTSSQPLSREPSPSRQSLLAPRRQVVPGAFGLVADTAGSSTSLPRESENLQQQQRPTSTSITFPLPTEPRQTELPSQPVNAMSNPQAGFYPMASPMAAYQPQLYGQNGMSPSGYYQNIPQPPVGLNSGYLEPRQGMTGLDYYQSSMPYSQASYAGSYSSSYASNTSGATSSYGSPIASQQFPQTTPPASLAGAPMQVVDRAKKPQCWEHGCNGREFSTFSNLLRHQREKSGTAAKSYCPHCGAEFTRTTARNGHMEHGKCKTRRSTSGS